MFVGCLTVYITRATHRQRYVQIEEATNEGRGKLTVGVVLPLAGKVGADVGDVLKSYTKLPKKTQRLFSLPSRL